MDINDIRSVLTVLAFVSFIGIVVWAYSGRRRSAFNEAANLPFTEEELPGSARQCKEGKAS